MRYVAAILLAMAGSAAGQGPGQKSAELSVVSYETLGTDLGKRITVVHQRNEAGGREWQARSLSSGGGPPLPSPQQSWSHVDYDAQKRNPEAILYTFIVGNPRAESRAGNSAPPQFTFVFGERQQQVCRGCRAANIRSARSSKGA